MLIPPCSCHSVPPADRRVMHVAVECTLSLGDLVPSLCVPTWRTALHCYQPRLLSVTRMYRKIRRHWQTLLRFLCPFHNPYPVEVSDGWALIWAIFMWPYLSFSAFLVTWLHFLNVQICDRCRCRLFVRPVVIFRKPSKIDSYQLWNTIRKLASPIPLPHSHPAHTLPIGRYSGFKHKLCSNSNTTSCSSLVSEDRSRWFTIGLCVANAKVEQEAGKQCVPPTIFFQFLKCFFFQMF